MDEAQFAPDALILQAIAPALYLNGTAAIFITTPDDPDSMFMRLISRVDEAGNPYMPVIWLGQPCSGCKAAGKDVCKHNWYHQPSHKSAARAERLGFIYAENKDISDRENNARLALNHGISFPSHVVDGFFNEPHRSADFIPTAVFLAVDPACGGVNDFAMVAGYYEPRGFTVRFSATGRTGRRRRSGPRIRRARLRRLCRSAPRVVLPVVCVAGACAFDGAGVARAWLL